MQCLGETEREVRRAERGEVNMYEPRGMSTNTTDSGRVHLMRVVANEDDGPYGTRALCGMHAPDALGSWGEWRWDEGRVPTEMPAGFCASCCKVWRSRRIRLDESWLLSNGTTLYAGTLPEHVVDIRPLTEEEASVIGYVDGGER